MGKIVAAVKSYLFLTEKSIMESRVLVVIIFLEMRSSVSFTDVHSTFLGAFPLPFIHQDNLF
jgi:hypothetical protein